MSQPLNFALSLYDIAATQRRFTTGTFMQQFVSWEIASKDNKWQGSNPTRWRNEEYDKIFREAQSELDSVKRAALFIAMNDMVVDDGVVATRAPLVPQQ